jgi:hypothetical protein
MKNRFFLFRPLSPAGGEGARWAGEGAAGGAIVLSMLIVLTACNHAPGPLTVSFENAEATTTDDLVLSIEGGSDPDGDEVSTSITWFMDGDTQNLHAGSTSVPADATVKHQVWEAYVVPSDGALQGPAASVQLTILNTPPELELELSPEIPLTGEDVESSVIVFDADGDDVSVAYQWYLDDELTSYDEPTLPSDATERGQVWTLEVIPNDEDDDGLEVTASVNIQNTAPSIDRVALSPEEPYETDTIVASVEATDPDEDPVTLSFTWYVDGELVQEGSESSLTGEHFDKHHEVYVEVWGHDGFIDGDALASSAVTVLNSPPSITGVVLEPSEIYEETEVACSPQGWSDADGDEPWYSYVWEVDGYVVSKDATLTGALFDEDQTVKCTATPSDGEATGTAFTSAVATVLNTPPVLASVTLSTTSPVEGDTITTTLGALTDVDGDATTVSYAWFVDGVQVSTASSIDSTLFDKHQDIHVEVTPSDGDEDGVVVVSSTATAANTPPEIGSLSFDSSEVFTNDVLGTLVATTDADGDEVSLSFAWTVGGVATGETDESLDGAVWFDKHETVEVVVTPFDGESMGSAEVAALVCSNSPPTAPTVTVAPEAPEDQVDALVCSYLDDSQDEDGDDVSYSIAWLVDSVAYTGIASTTHVGGDTVPADDIHGEQVYTCQVTPHDGEDEGDVGVATTTAEWYYNGWSTWEVALSDADVVLSGESVDDGAGTALASGGDFDNDGISDVLIGAPGVDGTYPNAGRAYLFSGASLAGSGALDLSAADLTFTGRSGGTASSYHGNLGTRFDMTGDLDGDGYSDLVVGSGRGGNNNQGLMFVIYGSSLSWASDYDLGGDADLFFDGDGDEHPHAMSVIGDLDGDGLDELVTGHPSDNDGGCCNSGKVALFLGSTLAGSSSLEIDDGDFMFIGTYNDYFGRDISGGADLDGDGLADFAVGQHESFYMDGGVHVYFSSSFVAPGYYASTDSDLYINDPDDCGSSTCGPRFGETVLFEGDVDGDGYPELIVGEYGDDAGGEDSGAVFVFSGADLNGITGANTSLAVTTFQGEQTGDAVGMRPSGMGQVDDDGYLDLMVSATQERGGTERGGAYLILSSTLMSGGSRLLSDADFHFLGESDGDLAGYSSCLAGDINGDGLSDVLIGAPSADSTGKAYLFFTP